MKPKNQPVGEVECSHKGCTVTDCKVFKFRPRTEGRRTVFTDKYYFECPTHGRVGADGNPTVTEYILGNAKLWGPGTAAADSQKNPAPAKTPAQGAQPGSSGELGRTAPAGKSTDQASPRSGWRTLLD